MTLLSHILEMILSISPAGIAFLIGMLIVPVVMRSMPTLLSIICVAAITWLYLHDTSISTVVLFIGLGEFLIIKLFLRARGAKAPRWTRKLEVSDEVATGKGKVR
jgi:hypothetical protein